MCAVEAPAGAAWSQVQARHGVRAVLYGELIKHAHFRVLDLTHAWVQQQRQARYVWSSHFSSSFPCALCARVVHLADVQHMCNLRCTSCPRAVHLTLHPRANVLHALPYASRSWLRPTRLPTTRLRLPACPWARLPPSTCPWSCTTTTQRASRVSRACVCCLFNNMQRGLKPCSVL
jgi:hypothetical protein